MSLALVLFASHGATVEGYTLNDLMTFFGWINGLDQHRVPCVDFPAPVEVLAHILPWLGSQISGQFAGAMGPAGVLVTEMLLALACITLRWRASTAFVVGFGLLLRKLGSTFVGFDSAWTGKNPGGIVYATSEQDHLLALPDPKLICFDEAARIIKWLRDERQYVLVAINQPTQVPNYYGMRPVERVAASLIGH